MRVSNVILLAAAVILMCLALSRVSSRIGVPALMVFIMLGMLFGSDGLFRISFDNYGVAETICSTSLIFIMFYGGFGTSWRKARPVAVKSLLLSSLGVVVTALLTGAFCRLALRMSWLEGLLIGSVIGSTDAASMFAILRSKHLNLKHNTASLLEMESGSNDPFAYMMTIITLSLMKGEGDGLGMVGQIIGQLLFGVTIGVVVALGCVWLMRRIDMREGGFDTVMVFGVALLAYSGAAALGGNGYLSTYIAGLILGNSAIPGKKTLVHFFDGMTGLTQIMIFFLLGLLSFPSRLPQVALPALAIALFLTFVARPAAVLMLMSPFRSPMNQQLLVSWAGLRGASSIVFAIMAVVDPANVGMDIFHMVFFIVLFSIAIQGTLLPFAARKLDMIDDKEDVMRTFSDYSEETPVQFLQLVIGEEHPWANRSLQEIDMLPDVRVALVIRGGRQVVPRGATVLEQGDTVVLSGPSLKGDAWGTLTEIPIMADHEWVNLPLREVSMAQHMSVILVKRDAGAMIPDGDTVLLAGDVLVVNHMDS